MALDVYVGTLSRYYAQEWKNAAQKLAEEQGVEYGILYAREPTKGPPSLEEARTAVLSWCEFLSEDFVKSGWNPVEWNEDPSRPYFTERPGWDGLVGLILWAAYADNLDLPLPARLPDSWIEDEALQRSLEKDADCRYLTIVKPQFWIPVEFPFVLEATTLTSEEPEAIGSTYTLRDQLTQLKEQTALRLMELQTAEPPPPASTGGPGFLSRWFNRQPPPESLRPPLAACAADGLDTCLRLANLACELRLPMLLDY